MDARLASEIDLAGFREEARVLLAHQVPPESVEWHAAPARHCDPFADPALAADSRPQGVPKAASAIVPASFLRLCEVVVLHQDPQRFALLYRLLWRLVHEPGLRNNPLDPDMLHAHQIGQAVRRDMHKMKTFLRFHTVAADAGEPFQLSWFEPHHHIVEAVAPWFAKRTPQPRWAILTPQRSVEWDGQRLHYGPGLPRERAPAADDKAWLSCYQAVFGDHRTNAKQVDGATSH
ncbi:MAG: TIGR03915 family putative DNA repair protein [Ramlibacter sp.]